MKTTLKNRIARALRAAAVSIVFGVQFVLLMPSSLRARLRWGGAAACFANEVGVGTHEKTITKFSASAIATRHLLFGQDATDSRKVTAIATTVRPLYAVADEVAATDLANTGNLAPVSCIILGTTNDTVRMVANAAGIKPGDPVYAVANGYVDLQANLTTGTWYLVGHVVARTSTAQGDLLEVAACAPTVSVTV